jgi:hypothetical protein
MTPVAGGFFADDPTSADPCDLAAASGGCLQNERMKKAARDGHRVAGLEKKIPLLEQLQPDLAVVQRKDLPAVPGARELHDMRVDAR